MKNFQDKAKQFKRWATTNTHLFHPVVDFQDKKVVHLDLSKEGVNSKFKLDAFDTFATLEHFKAAIDELIQAQSGFWGIGGYGEERVFYNTAGFVSTENEVEKWRNIHLGIDIWGAAGTEVFAPLDGKVHSFQFNNIKGDYGATIILEHPAPNLTFYTLYGHLSLASLEGLKKGEIVKKGEVIATFGKPEENGYWVPHLHFQVILDMLGHEGNFPGVAYQDEKAYWLELCPNPMLLIAQ